MAAMTGRLLAIDGLNIVRRVYEASPEPDSDLKAEIAMRHAFNAFQRLVNGHEPSHILPAFDYGGPTWRHSLYKGYREGRQPMPEVLREALPEFYMQLTRIGMCPIAIPEVEADDVIGTVVTRWLSENRGEAVVATTDKDLHCLIAEGARPIHLVVSDVVMPEMGGRELGQRLSLLEPTLQILYMSGYTGEDVVRRGLLEAGSPFLQKPFSTEALGRKSREMLDAPIAATRQARLKAQTPA